VWAGLIWLRTGTGCGFCIFQEIFKGTFDLFISERNYHIGLFLELIKYNMVVSLNHQYRTNKRFAENLLKTVLVVEICHFFGGLSEAVVCCLSVFVLELF
jgi:hypothetical protein